MKAALALLAAFLVGSASAQQGLPDGLTGERVPLPLICGDTRVLYESLSTTHNELPVAIGFTTADTAVVWFTNPERTTLSIVIDAPTRSCIIYSSKCLPGDCWLTPEQNFEQEEEKMLNNDAPKVSL